MARLPDGVQAREAGSGRQYRAVVTDRSRRLPSGAFARVSSRWFDKQAEAVRWRDATAADLKRTGHIPVERDLTVAEACRRWLLEATTVGIAGRHKIRGSTARRYEKTIANKIEPTIGDRACAELRPSHIRVWATEQAILAGSDEVQRGLAVMRGAFALMVEHERMTINPAAEIRIASSAGSDEDADSSVVTVFLEPDEVKAVLDAADRLADHSGTRGSGQIRKAWIRYRPMAYFLFGTGVRIGEALALRWRNVDLETGMVRIDSSLDDMGKVTAPKTASSVRSLRLGEEVLARLRELHESRDGPGDDDFVFGGRTPLDRSNAVNRMWNPLMEEASISGFSFHDCRHYHASALIAAGMQDVKVSSRLGHSSVAITRKIYVHAFKSAEAGRESEAVALESVILGR